MRRRRPGATPCRWAVRRNPTRSPTPCCSSPPTRRPISPARSCTSMAAGSRHRNAQQRAKISSGGNTMTAGSISRRLALGVAAVLLAGTPARAADPSTVVVASFGSLWQEALEKALAPFEAERNVKIRYTAGSSADNVARAIAARNHPDVDVVMGEEMTFGQGHQEKIWEKLDPAVVTNLANVVPQAKMGDGEGVGVIMQAIGLFYRTDYFQKNNWQPPTSWGDLADKKYCHRIGVGDPNVSFSYYAFMMLGGGKPDDFSAGVKRLAAIRDCFDTLDPSAGKTPEKNQPGEYGIGGVAPQPLLTQAKK